MTQNHYLLPFLRKKRLNFSLCYAFLNSLKIKRKTIYKETSIINKEKMIVLLISLENHRQTEGIQNTNLSFYIYRYLLTMTF